MSFFPNTIFLVNKSTGRRKLFFLKLLLLKTIFFLNSQTSSFSYFVTDQGLLSNQVTAIEQDREGYLFIGTMAGLNIYDGTQFVSYGKNQGLAEQWITSLKKDSQGNIWIGHWAGGISRWNIQTKKIENIHTEKIFNYQTVKKIKQDSKGIIWFGTQGSGIFSFDYKTKKIEQLKQSAGKNIFDFVFWEDKIISASDEGIALYVQPSNYQKESARNFSLREGLFSNNITSLFIDENTLWVGSADKGLMNIGFN